MRNYMFDKMSSSDIEKLKKIFDNADLYFKFDDGTKKRFRRLIPDIKKLKNKQRPKV